MSELMKKFVGYIAYPGEFEGIVCLDYTKIKKGEVLVTTATTPAQIEAMTKAVGILVERKGFVQHATIIAREFKIPTVVGIDNITKKLKDGDFIFCKNDNELYKAVIQIK